MSTLYSMLAKSYESEQIRIFGFLEQMNKVHGEKLTFDSVIDSDELCLDLIRFNLDFKSKEFQVNKAYAYRFRHIVICWLMGVALSKFIGNENEFDMIFHKSWQLASFTHDYGYFCEEVFSDLDDDFLESFGDYYLLKDEYENPILSSLNNYLERNRSLLSVGYKDIENYFYKDQLRRRNAGDEEKNDHGICGGCIAFKEYIQYLENRAGLLDGIRIKEINKIACLITASHNIWGIRIKEENRLQLLMALVDTIESTKRFCKKDKNGRLYPVLKWKDILNNIDIQVSDLEILIDFSNLISLVSLKKDSEFLLECCEKQVDNISGLNTWTYLKTERIGNSIVISK